MKQYEIDRMSLMQRITAPTPRFFQFLKAIGVTLAAVSAALLAAPVELPPIVTRIAGYLAIAGAVATAISQFAVQGEAPKD